MEQALLHAYDPALEAMRRGLQWAFPGCALECLFAWGDLEAVVCGAPGVSVAQLRRCARWPNLAPASPLPAWLWDTLEAWPTGLRQQFLRFATAYSRLPPPSAHFALDITVLPRAATSDDELPTSATCANRLTLPAYSSRAVLEARLRYALENCPNIDADVGNTDRSAYM